MISPEQAISPYDDYCDGYGNPGAVGTGYYLGLVLGLGVAPQELGSKVLDEIHAFDKAEVNDTNIGQINMITVSSFVGPQGLIWGHDLVRPQESFYPHPLLEAGEIYSYQEQTAAHVYSAQPVTDATRALFGTRDHKRFPLRPGAHVLCATKNFVTHGPAYIYTAAGIGIPKDRQLAACLLMEDVGSIPEELQTADVLAYKAMLLRNIVKSVLAVGANQRVQYEQILVDIQSQRVNESEVGCALVAAPYFTLAKKALGEDPEKLTQMTLEEWETSLSA